MIDLYTPQTNALVQYTTLTADPSTFAREALLLEGEAIDIHKLANV
jgi:hypothetical protein